MDAAELDKSSEINNRVISGLKILMSGQTLPWQGYQVGLARTHNDSFMLYYTVSSSEGYDKVMGCEMPFDHLYKWLDEISEEDRLGGLAGIVLKDFNRKRF